MARPFGSSVLDWRNAMNGKTTKKDSGAKMRSRYDFSGGVRGKYAREYRKATNVVVLAPDVAAEFKTSAAVNRALRQIARTRRASGT
jgi:hypothetical protein